MFSKHWASFGVKFFFFKYGGFWWQHTIFFKSLGSLGELVKKNMGSCVRRLLKIQPKLHYVLPPKWEYPRALKATDPLSVTRPWIKTTDPLSATRPWIEATDPVQPDLESRLLILQVQDYWSFKCNRALNQGYWSLIPWILILQVQSTGFVESMLLILYVQPGLALRLLIFYVQSGLKLRLPIF